METALQILESNIFGYDVKYNNLVMKDMFKKAIVLERKQIQDAFEAGKKAGMQMSSSIEWGDIEEIESIQTAESYYIENYNKQ